MKSQSWSKIIRRLLADLVITSDPEGNARCIVKLGASCKVVTFINTLWNQVAEKTVNPI